MSSSFDPTTATLWDAWSLYPKDDLARPNNYHTRLRQIDRLMGRAAVAKIDDDWLAELRDRGIEYGYASSTIRSLMKFVQQLLRYVGPRETGNPRGLSLIESHPPYAKFPKLVIKRPKRVPLDDLSRVYVACQAAKIPKNKGVPTADLWRTALVVCYVTALRRGDLFNLTWSQVDFAERVIDFEASKTGKYGTCPLTDYAIEHLRRIKIEDDPSAPVFRGWWRHKGGRTYRQFKRLCEKAGVGQFRFQDIRRTACCEIDRVKPGLGQEILQHSPRGVTAIHYLNRLEELREAVGQMRVPIGFKAAPRMHERREQQKQKKELQRLYPEDFDSDVGPDRTEWRFNMPTRQYRFRGRWYRLKTDKQIVLLALLVRSGKPVSRSRIYQQLVAKCGYALIEERTPIEVSRLRNQLKRQLGLEQSGWDPVPMIGSHSARPACWTVHIPRHLKGGR